MNVIQLIEQLKQVGTEYGDKIVVIVDGMPREIESVMIKGGPAPKSWIKLAAKEN